MITHKYQYSELERSAIYRTIRERRDMRHFNQLPIDESTLQRLFEVAHQAPSVGLMQPWRIIHITSPTLRSQIHQLVDQERMNTAAAMNEREHEFMQLKVEGIKDCAEVIVMALKDKREAHIFGRRTMPDMDLASVSCAIQNMWLAARSEGLGMGWVSLFEPNQLAQLLNMPEGASPVAILCLGHVDEFYPAPMLELEKWTESTDISDIVFTDGWNNKVTP